jgi:hypothetical protein
VKRFEAAFDLAQPLQGTAKRDRVNKFSYARYYQLLLGAAVRAEKSLDCFAMDLERQSSVFPVSQTAPRESDKRKNFFIDP